MFAITPNYLAEVYNRYRNDVYEDEPGFLDRWGMLSDEQRQELVKAIEGYIDKTPLLHRRGPHRRTGRSRRPEWPPKPWNKTPDRGEKEMIQGSYPRVQQENKADRGEKNAGKGNILD